ncbi:endoplasmic reticulum resident protein 27 isoform X3 [Cavia porcellus]|uniref:endoplasmic reticulum resident protein 27 isoform X3 n=1 Tax=Cavia porcellus TaxID=10141 RepID=UPI002FE3CA11
MMVNHRRTKPCLPALPIPRNMTTLAPALCFGDVQPRSLCPQIPQGSYPAAQNSSSAKVSQVDNEQLKLEGEELESIDATKLSHFISINNLRWVTEYNSMTGSGLFNSQIEIHLLLIIDKASPEYEKNMHRYQEAAKLFQKKVLFVLVDSGVMENQRAISYFRLKMSQLPALAIYRTVDDKWDTLPIKEVTLEQVQNFYDGFLEGKLLVSVRLQVAIAFLCISCSMVLWALLSLINSIRI